MAQRQILIVDDDADLVAILTTVLRSAGYRVASASNGEEALARARESRPDVAVVDVIMNTLSEGIQLTHRFRADRALKDMPIIMLTAVNQRLPLNIGPETDDGYLPVDRFMEKPVNPAMLLKAIGELLPSAAKG